MEEIEDFSRLVDIEFVRVTGDVIPRLKSLSKPDHE
jgi:hypothetical protein